MSLIRSAAFVGASLVAAASSVSAQAASTAVGARVSTLGLGLEASLGLNDYLNLRLPFNLFNYNFDDEQDGVPYDGKLKLKSIGAQLDYHPFKGTFFLTGGLFANGNKLDLFAQDKSGTEEYQIGDDDRVYTSDTSDPLTLKGGLDVNSAAPYIGLGWGNPIQGASNFYFRFELGAYFQGSAKVGLNASGSAVDQQTGQSFSTTGNTPEAQLFQAQLEEERASLQDDLTDYEIYPVIGFTLGYRFSL
ncbi:hypothetical protein [Hydrocarboniphaga sp.]|uniref:hypothetical protein n=1 Tax=Hydrocarboniphaga sp. TaxID=2033016 RepID=UPI003D09DB6E